MLFMTRERQVLRVAHVQREGVEHSPLFFAKAEAREGKRQPPSSQSHPYIRHAFTLHLIRVAFILQFIHSIVGTGSIDRVRAVEGLHGPAEPCTTAHCDCVCAMSVAW